MLAVAAMAAFSCAKETENQNDAVKPEVKTPLVITAYTDDDIAPDTKTSLSGVSVVWTTTDVIAGYEGVTKHTSTSTAVSDGGKKATFTFSEVSVDANLDYLVYPAAAAGAYDAGLININLPSEQTAVANSFANGANLSLAEGLVDDDAVLFKNLGGLIGIQINNDDIASVKFSANEAMTGAGVVDPSDCSTLCDGAKYVKLSGGLANGTPYYAVIYPRTYSGLQIEVTNTSGQVATYTNDTPLTIERNDNLFIAELTIPSGKWVTPTKGSEYSWTLESGDLGVSATPATSVTKGSPLTTWDTAFTWSSSAFLNTDGTKGVQVGSGSNPCSALTLSTSGYTQYVESVVVNFSHASSGGAALSVTVGDTALKNGEKTVVNATNTATAYTFNAASLVKGDIVLRFTNSASKAFYVKSIVINPDTRTAVTLSFDDEAIDDQTTVSHTFTGQAVNSSTDATAVTSNIIWGITGDAITSSFSTSTGALVLNGSAGTATVTASFAGDENYKPANASYSISVSKVKLTTPSASASKSGTDAIAVSWTEDDALVASYTVTCTDQSNRSIDAGGTASTTFSSLDGGIYTVTVVAVPTDTDTYVSSDAWTSSSIKIGDDPVAFYTATFEGDGERQTDTGSNNYTGSDNTYTVSGVSWTLNYADAVSNANRLDGDGDIMARIAKNADTHPTAETANILSAEKTITKITFLSKLTNMTLAVQYHDGGTSWKTITPSKDTSVEATYGYSYTFTTPITVNTFKLKFTWSRSSGTAKIDSQLDDITVIGY